jgi:hypothetical protein
VFSLMTIFPITSVFMRPDESTGGGESATGPSANSAGDGRWLESEWNFVYMSSA